MQAHRHFRGEHCLNNQGNDGGDAHTSETSVYTNKTTRRYSREGCRLQTCCREDVKSPKARVQGQTSAVAATKLGCHGNKNLQGQSSFRSIDRKVDGSIVSKQYARFSHNSSWCECSYSWVIQCWHFLWTPGRNRNLGALSLTSSEEKEDRV